MLRWRTGMLAIGLLGTSAPAWACDETIHQGVATFYDFADGSGVCGYPASTGNQMVVALDAPELAATAMCGACIEVSGPKGKATVLVVNGCPECEVGHLDLSPQAYDVVAKGYSGVPPITWKYVPCDVPGPIKYAYFKGSSTAFAWVQVRNHRHPIAKLEAKIADGSFVTLERADWGYFKATNLPAGGQTYRATDIYGNVLVDTGIAVIDEGEVAGKAQFPSCSGSGGPIDAGAPGASSSSSGAAGTSSGGMSSSTSGGGANARATPASGDEGGCGVRPIGSGLSTGGLLLAAVLLVVRRGRAVRRRR